MPQWGLGEWLGLEIKWVEVHWNNVSPFPPSNFVANLGRTFPPFDRYSLLQKKTVGTRCDQILNVSKMQPKIVV